MPELNRARHPVDKSSVRWRDAERVVGGLPVGGRRGWRAFASSWRHLRGLPTVERGAGLEGWLQASILGLSQSCEERDSPGSEARCDRAGHPSRQTVPSGQAPPVYHSVA